MKAKGKKEKKHFTEGIRAVPYSGWGGEIPPQVVGLVPWLRESKGVRN